ncbi:YCF48-related protein [Aliiglaciecola sp. LCG003]|uniref:YCF48-related protein n=1 Tax=Aliiglaciecola sp. LCG003 TaxID=3053655 RepID=UPI0025735247|nr:YCF48-related protein [Aliiglaciecola sp. LCG003]WJG07652.1 YCF48-related protein [Aliiglaciecola sp. LCG003]
MKRINFITLMTLVSLTSMSGFPEESYLAPLAKESLLLDITRNDTHYIVVGERGHVLDSVDGLSWTQKTVPTLSTLTAVASYGQQSWAVGHDAIILHQAANDQNWQVQMFSPESEKPLLDVLFFDNQEGIAVGAYGTFFRTKDSGESWNKEVHSELLDPEDVLYLDEIRLEDEAFYQAELGSIMPHLNKVTQVDDMLYLAGESGLLASSADRGVSWQRMDVDYYGSFFDVAGLSNGDVVAVGLRGHIFILEKDSQEWQIINSGITSSLNTIIALQDGSFVTLGNAGYMVCVMNGDVTKSHIDDGKAINAALKMDNQLMLASAVGIKHLALDKQQSVCERTSVNL